MMPFAECHAALHADPFRFYRATLRGATVFFAGSVGWETGTIEGCLATDIACTGDRGNAIGRARFTCEHGRLANASSGRNVIEKVTRALREVTLRCGAATIPLT